MSTFKHHWNDSFGSIPIRRSLVIETTKRPLRNFLRPTSPIGHLPMYAANLIPDKNLPCTLWG